MRFIEFKLNENTEFTLNVPTHLVGPDVADLQKVLVQIGYDIGPPGIDGIRGKYTTAAIKALQTDVGFTANGVPDEQLINLLNGFLSTNSSITSSLTKSTAADVKSHVSDIDVSIIQDPDFNSKLQKISHELGVDANDLLAIMKLESGVDPSRVNPLSNATGLIQFMPKTAHNLGTSVEELRGMTAVEQLDYVFKYFKMIGVKPGMDVGDLYLAVFYPAAIGKKDNHVISTAGKQIYNQNKVLDKNKDGTLTVADVKNSVARFV